MDGIDKSYPLIKALSSDLTDKVNEFYRSNSEDENILGVINFSMEEVMLQIIRDTVVGGDDRESTIKLLIDSLERRLEFKAEEDNEKANN